MTGFSPVLKLKIRTIVSIAVIWVLFYTLLVSDRFGPGNLWKIIITKY